MTDVNSTTCTAITINFEGFEHAEAAHDFIIQFSDGGLDQHLESMFTNIDRNLDLDKSDFDTGKREITLGFQEKPIV